VRCTSIERTIKDESRKKREQTRLEQIGGPSSTAFFQWCDEQAAHALDGTPLAAALRLCPKPARWRCGRFLEDDRLAAR
jgi:hypothetical protein